MMQGAGTDELSYSIIPPLQRWFNELNIKNSTLFRAELLANYELRSIEDRTFRYRDPTPGLVKSLDHDIQWPFLRVTVPAKAFSTIPHMAIVAHEIGHALFQQYHWTITSFVQTEGTALQQRIATRLGASHIAASTNKILNVVLWNWIEELAADAFAFFLTGPAIFFSLPEFFQFLGSGYGMYDTHPAHDLRRRTLFVKLFDGTPNSFADVFSDATGQTLTEEFNSPLVLTTPQDAAQVEADMLGLDFSREQAVVMAELHTSIPKLIDAVYAQAGDYLNRTAPDAIYSPQRYKIDLELHMPSMLEAVPPIETGDTLSDKVPTDFASILNVGWAVLLTRLDDLRVRVPKSDRYGAGRLDVLQGLLSKAVELSEARRTWQS